MSAYDFCEVYLIGLVTGVFVAAALGAWIDRRKRGRIPFMVVRTLNPNPDWDELERILLDEHQTKAPRRAN
jgi:hypothetical protein